jgi:hypothetical protein
MGSSRRMTPRLGIGYALLLLSGCGGVVDHSRGSNIEGRLIREGTPVPDVIVSVYPAEARGERVAFGVTDELGVFRLVADDGRSPAKLPSGDYVLTVESQTGALTMPKNYGLPEQTPLQGRVEGDEAVWEFDITPARKP